MDTLAGSDTLCEGKMDRLERAIIKSNEGFNSINDVESMTQNQESGEFYSDSNIEQMLEGDLFDAKKMRAKRIIHPGQKNSRQLNQFRELRTKLLQNSNGRNFTVMVTSIVPGGGTTFIATNLAVAFAFEQSKTALLIDCNLKSPQIDNIFSLHGKAGLTDFLHDPTVGVEGIIQNSGIKRLRIIGTGQYREDGAEFFTFRGMENLMNHVSQRYNDRFTIIDSPCSTNSADTRILMEHSDKVVLVVPYGKVSTDEIDTAIHSIGPEKLAGIVMNNQPNIGR